MKCKRCHRVLPVGTKTHCPHCGMRVGTHITPRKPGRKKQRGLRRSIVMPLLTVVVIVGIAVVLAPILQQGNREEAFENIRDMYERIRHNDECTDQDCTEEKFTGEERDNRINWLMAAIANFESRFPDDAEAMEVFGEFRSALNIITMPPDLEGLPDVTGTPTEEQRQHHEMLIGTARDHIIDIASYQTRSPDRYGRVGIDVSFENKSGRDINRVSFFFRALDSNGNPMTTENDEGDTVWHDAGSFSENIRAGESVGRTYLALWDDREVAAAKLIFVSIIYTDGTTVNIPEAVCTVLWPPS